jgi:hypothetical protein
MCYESALGNLQQILTETDDPSEQIHLNKIIKELQELNGES